MSNLSCCGPIKKIKSGQEANALSPEDVGFGPRWEENGAVRFKAESARMF